MRAKRRAVPDATDATMVVSLNTVSEQVFLPTLDPVLQQLNYYFSFQKNIYDTVTLKDNAFQESLPAGLNAQADCRWLSYGYVPTPKPVLLDEGVNNIPVLYPVQAILSLVDTLTKRNNWYGNPDFKKYGFVRRTQGDGKETQKWINSLTQEFHWDLDNFNGLEVVLAPGVIGSVIVAPALGVPPAYSNYNGNGTKQITPPWYYIGPTAVPSSSVGLA